jgi:hypothetical protein
MSRFRGVSVSARWIWLVTAFIWALAVVVWVDRFAGLSVEPYKGWLVDWHVYAAGSRDLITGDLYNIRLVSPYPIPVTRYNMPPGSAILTLPFMIFPDAIAGTLWVLLNIVAVGATAVLTARIVNARPVWFWSGAAFFVYSLVGWGMPAMLGNNTPLVLLIVAGFVAAHLAERSTLAGALLGIAIATKLWPATFLVVLARERSWRTLAWAVGTAGVIFIGAVLWLGGLEVIGPMARSLTLTQEITNQRVLGITWLRVYVDWWPAWGGFAIAVLLLLIPARGMAGYGLAALAGMAAIPNLWRHYLGTIIFGLVLLIRGLALFRREPSPVGRPLPSTADHSPRTDP